MHRSACVQAINAFRQTQGLTPLVVCSREAEFRALATPLTVRQAVVVQPLTAAQIIAYLRQGGKALAAVRAALTRDPALHSLLDTPLMLNILALAYEGVPVGTDIPTARWQIFAAYVQRMLTRRGASAAYPLEQTQARLVNLAHQMVKHNQTVFYIEHLQPDWLPYRRNMFYRLLWRLGSAQDAITPAETLIWSWQGFRASLFGPAVRWSTRWSAG